MSLSELIQNTFDKPSNWFAFAALIAYLLSLIPGIVRTVFPNLRKTNWSRFLMKYRRETGLAAFFFAVVHGAMIGIERNLDFSNIETALTYTQGIVMMQIFVLLSITSNNWSVKNLRGNWHKLHTLTYMVLLILPWHILDKVGQEWTIFTPIGLLLLSIALVLFGIRLFKAVVNYQKT